MNDAHYMQRCIQLAMNGSGFTAPNPMVGSVIVHNDTIIGEGWHKEYGKEHAEINALSSVKDHSLLSESTLYVNLEPCSHYGKTPPCSDAIIKSGLKKVVIGMQDPFSEVNGRGISRLKEAGIEVVSGVEETACRKLNKRFITFHEKQRPYIILKWAESADGFIGRPGERVKVSNDYTQVLVHRWRSEEVGIMVGTTTVLNDNPRLDARFWNGRNPVRITIDRELKLKEDLNIFDGSQPTLIFTYKEKESGNNCSFITLKRNENELIQIMQFLYGHNLQSVLVEGGSILLNTFINNAVWDEARVIHAPVTLNSGITAPAFDHSVSHSEKSGDDVINFYYNK
jgi:diaminohydroxyphosphoribosylaminopyrimidine deaminase / 5-amino-6-(5-phosphoribosylamino)uracil reductase